MCIGFVLGIECLLNVECLNKCFVFLCEMSFICVKESDDFLMCNGSCYDFYEDVLSYKDLMFWVYLGIYVGLVLFVGEIQF